MSEPTRQQKCADLARVMGWKLAHNGYGLSPDYPAVPQPRALPNPYESAADKDALVAWLAADDARWAQFEAIIRRRRIRANWQQPLWLRTLSKFAAPKGAALLFYWPIFRRTLRRASSASKSSFVQSFRNRESSSAWIVASEKAARSCARSTADGRDCAGKTGFRFRLFPAMAISPAMN